MQPCLGCGIGVTKKRKAKGYKLCLPCGDIIAHERKFTVACNNKQGYELITNLNDLKTLNPKRTL
jgi:hypothetical protein